MKKILFCLLLIPCFSFAASFENVGDGVHVIKAGATFRAIEHKIASEPATEFTCGLAGNMKNNYMATWDREIDGHVFYDGDYGQDHIRQAIWSGKIYGIKSNFKSLSQQNNLNNSTTLQINIRNDNEDGSDLYVGCGIGDTTPINIPVPPRSK